MRLFMKIIPLRAGTGEPTGESHILPCPPDVEPDTLLSFLPQTLGEVTETVWTSTDRHRLGLPRPRHRAAGRRRVGVRAAHRDRRRVAAAPVRSPSRPAPAVRAVRRIVLHDDRDDGGPRYRHAAFEPGSTGTKV